MSQALQAKDFDDIVFEQRNKEYGAYILRKRYNRTMNRALLIALAVLLLAVSIPTIARLLSELNTETIQVQQVDLTLTEPPPLDKNEPPPPPPPPDPPPPVQETIKFTPPVVVEEVKEEDIPPPQEVANETTVSTVTQEGTKDIDDIPDEGNKVIEDDQQVFLYVEKNPEFPGGDAELYKYLNKNLKYPAMARENHISGKVYVTFVVEKSGEITGVQVLRGIGGGCDEEAVRVVKNMPKWNPGNNNGRAVRVQFNLPVIFSLR